MKKIVLVKIFGFRAETHVISAKLFVLFKKMEDSQLNIIEFPDIVSRDSKNQEVGIIIIRSSFLTLKKLSKILFGDDFLLDKRIIFAVNKIYQPRIKKSRKVQT